MSTSTTTSPRAIRVSQPRPRRQAQTASSATATTSQTIHWRSWRPRVTIAAPAAARPRRRADSPHPGQLPDRDREQQDHNEQQPQHQDAPAGQVERCGHPYRPHCVGGRLGFLGGAERHDGGSGPLQLGGEPAAILAQLGNLLGLALNRLPAGPSSATNGPSTVATVACTNPVSASACGVVVGAVAATLAADGRSSAAGVAAASRYTSQTVPCGRWASSARSVPLRIRRFTVVIDTPRMAAACSTVTAVVAAAFGASWPLVAAESSFMVGAMISDYWPLAHAPGRRDRAVSGRPVVRTCQNSTTVRRWR